MSFFSEWWFICLTSERWILSKNNKWFNHLLTYWDTIALKKIKIKSLPLLTETKEGKGGRGRGRKEGVKSDVGEGNEKEIPKETRST